MTLVCIQNHVVHPVSYSTSTKGLYQDRGLLKLEYNTYFLHFNMSWKGIMIWMQTRIILKWPTGQETDAMPETYCPGKNTMTFEKFYPL